MGRITAGSTMNRMNMFLRCDSFFWFDISKILPWICSVTIYKIYKTTKQGNKSMIVFDTAQAIANIYEYNRKLGARY